MNRERFTHKKAKIVVLTVYILSYVMNALFFAITDVGAEAPLKNTNIVAILVDSEIYQNTDIKSKIEWYAKTYTQDKISDSVGFVIPVNKKTFKSYDISKILQNMYFGGIRDKTSKLVGTVLIGDLPMPIVNRDGFLFPSVFPYVDFVNPKFIYNPETKYFDYKDQGANSPAEIWHGLIDFGDKIPSYTAYFDKLKLYNDNPVLFVAKKIWYEDFVELKKTFLDQNVGFYVNNFLFAEDLTYSRFTNFFQRLLQGQYQESVEDLAGGLKQTGDGTTPVSEALNAYVGEIQKGAEQTKELLSNNVTETPTLFLQKAMRGYLKPYSDLFGTLYLSRIKENVGTLKRYASFDNHVKSVMTKDSMILGNKLYNGNGDMQHLLRSMNMKAENQLDARIEQQKYYMNIPVPVEFYIDYVNDIIDTDDVKYSSFFYGFTPTRPNFVSAQDFSLFRGTFRNYGSATGFNGSGFIQEDQSVTDISLRSLGSSYKMFDQQVEANRGYNLDKIKGDLKTFQEQKCDNDQYSDQNGEDEDTLNPLKYFVQQYRGGVTPLNLDGETMKLNNLDYNDGAIGGKMYDIAGSQGTKQEFSGAYSYEGMMAFGNMRLMTFDENEFFNHKKTYCEEYGDTNTALNRYVKNRPLISFFDAVNRGYESNKVKVINGPALYNNIPDDMPIVQDNAQQSFGLGPLNNFVNNTFSVTQQQKRDYIENIDSLDDYGARINFKIRTKKDSSDMLRPEGGYKEKSFGGSVEEESQFTDRNFYDFDFLYKTIDSRVFMKAPTQQQIAGMNLTTKDRPVDSQRYVSFQGVGGSLVKIMYPNFFEVEVYEKLSNGLLRLKSQTEIKNAIRDYLKKRVVQYNQELQNQLNQKNTYYQSKAEAFDFLNEVDANATPNRSYELLPENYFDEMFGDNEINLIAHSLYYSNLGLVEKQQPTGISESLQQSLSTFDVNQKISYVMDFLQQGQRVGKAPVVGLFEYPNYESNGYEQAYINSDGSDYIQSETVPSIITDIQAKIEQSSQEKNKVNDEIQLVIDKDNQECGAQSDGAVPILKRPKAFMCWLDGVKKMQFVSIDFKNSQGPVLMSDDFKNLLQGTDKGPTQSLIDKVGQVGENVADSIGGAVMNIVDDVKMGVKKYEQQRDQATKFKEENDKTLLALDPQASSELQSILDGADIQFLQKTENTQDELSSVSQIYVEPFGGFSQQLFLQLGGIRDFGSVDLSLSSTGDNCLFIESVNSCLQPYSLKNINIFRDQKLLNVSIAGKKAGNVLLKVEACTAENRCVVLSDLLPIVPGNLKTVDFIAPAKRIIRGAQLPVVMQGKDSFGNTVGKTLEPYQLSSKGGTVGINGGFGTSTMIQDFEDFPILYNSENALGNNDEIKVTGIEDESFQQNFIVQLVTGDVKVYQNGQPVSKIVYSLPDRKDDITYFSEFGLPQINESKLPSISIKVTDTEGKPVYSTVQLSSQHDLLKPGEIKKYSRALDGNSLFEESFKTLRTFTVSNGDLPVVFYPSFEAGKDTLTITVPGLKPISIPIQVYPGKPSDIQLSFPKETVGLQETFSGSAIVRDKRGNVFEDSTDLTVYVLGNGSINGGVSKKLSVQSGSASFTITPKLPGGTVHVYAKLPDETVEGYSPGYAKLLVRNSMFPKVGLNAMYLTLLGTDRGAIYGDNAGTIEKMISSSKKLLAVTTLSAVPGSAKKADTIISTEGGITPFQGSDGIEARFDDGDVVFKIADKAKVDFESIEAFALESKLTIDAITKDDLERIVMYYVPEYNDTTIETNKLSTKKILINNETVIDFDQQLLGPDVKIVYTDQKLFGRTVRNLVRGEVVLGKILFSNITSKILEPNAVITNGINYSSMPFFTEGSSNSPVGLMIYSSLEKLATENSYQSVENSNTANLGIGFQSDFKNVTYFADGKSVGASTLPFSSEYLINYGDPLLQRVSKNDTIVNTDFEAGIGSPVVTNPNKTIQEIKNFDFNVDGLMDMLVIYTDGSMQLLKNYGGNEPLQDLGNLMLVADGIKKVYVGDTNGDQYPDVVVQTNSDRLRTFLNKGGVFDVDGTSVCLNIPGGPDSVSGLFQFFVEDMDRDSNLDFVTYDVNGFVKIFYGGAVGGKPNYLSTQKIGCDSSYESRLKTVLVKQFGIQISDGEKIYDDSLIRWAGVKAEAPAGNFDTSTLPDGIKNNPQLPKIDLNNDDEISPEEIDAFKAFMANSPSMQTAGDYDVNSVLSSWLANNSCCRAVKSPMQYMPKYESNSTFDDIGYVPVRGILPDKDPVKVYKVYKDLNGGILKKGDKVRVTIKIEAKQDITVTYIDSIIGPWIIDKDDGGLMKNFDRGNTNSGSSMKLGDSSEFEFLIDNLFVSSSKSTEFSYTMEYQPTQIVRLILDKINKDDYVDIKAFIEDSCLKGFIQFIGNNGGTRKYQELFKDLQTKLNEDLDKRKENQATVMENVQKNIADVQKNGDLNALQGASILERFNPVNIFNELQANNGVMNFNLDLNIFKDQAAAIENTIDDLLQGLCKGFSLNSSCGGLPVPFNVDFLSPGLFQVMGCQILDFPGLPIFFFPGTLQTPIGPIPFPWGQKMSATPGQVTPTFPGAPDAPADPGPDTFFWAPGGIYPSMVRLYVTPTLTMGLGISLCLGPMKAGEGIPQPFRNIAGNCIVFGAMLPLNCTDKPGEVKPLPADIVDSKETGVCKRADAYDPINPLNPEIALPSQSPRSPYKMVSQVDLGALGSTDLSVAPDNLGYKNTLPSGPYGGGLISLDKTPITRRAGGEVGSVPLKGGKKIDLKVLGGDIKGIPACIIQKRLDNQVKYIINNLSSMTVTLTLPEISQLTAGFDKIDQARVIALATGTDLYKPDAQKKAEQEAKDKGEPLPKGPYDNLDININTDQDFGNTTDIDTQGGIVDTAKSATDVAAASAEEFVRNKLPMLQKAQLTNLSNKYGQNPFEAMVKLFDQVPLINVQTRDVNIQVPFIYSEDLSRYVAYLNTWLNTNLDVIDEWLDIGANVIGAIGINVSSKEQINALNVCKTKFANNSDEKDICVKEEMLKNITGSEEEGKQCRNARQGSTDEKKYKKWKKCLSKAISASGGKIDIPKKCAIEKTPASQDACVKRLTNYVSYFNTTAGNADQLAVVIRQNLQVLEKYRTFPLEMYDWLHVYERYMDEIAGILFGVVDSLTKWLNINARRFESYVDTIIMMIGIIKTRQVIIDFSTNWSSRCSSCTNDNYDSYACTLSFLCVNLPIIPIPPFKIPNIELDFSKLDIGMSLLLPKFNFVPTNVPLPRLPELPLPPQINIDILTQTLGAINIDNATFGLAGLLFPNLELPEISIPKIPILPSPPRLPKLPSFIPSVNIDLPVLPPPPKIPRIQPEIKASLDIIEWIGKIYCIMKGGIGLVGEKGVKSKVEQLTQRTRDVMPFDALNLTRNSTPLRGMDFRVETFVNLRFNFDQVVTVLNGLADSVNGVTRKYIENPISNAIQEGSRNVNNARDTTLQNNGFNQNININGAGAAPSNQQGFYSGDESYDSARTRLFAGLDYFNQKHGDTLYANSLQQVKAKIQENPNVNANIAGLDGVKDRIRNVIESDKKEKETLQNSLKNYDTFLDSLVKEKLVSDTQLDTTISTSLLTVNNSTKQYIQQQQAPEVTYGTLQKKLLNGFQNALQTKTSKQLNMTPMEKKNITSYFGNVEKKLDSVLGPQLAQNSNPTQSQGQSATAGNDPNLYDISQYVNGIFVETKQSDDTFVDVVQNKIFSDDIGDNIERTDFNKDGKEDLVLRDGKTVYVKYADENEIHLNDGKNTAYFVMNPSDTLIQFTSQLDLDGYATVNGLKFKVRDFLDPVYYLSMKGQNADNISFSWLNDKNAWGYLVQFQERVDIQNDKTSAGLYATQDLLQKRYILVVPQGTNLSGDVTLDNGLNGSVETLLENGTIQSVRTYEKGIEYVSIGLRDLEKKRYYLKVTPLMGKVGNSADSIDFSQVGPWSNQIVGGRQVYADNQGPSLSASLTRIKTNNRVGEGFAFNAYVQTNYRLDTVWEDNVGMKKSRIEVDGKVVATRDGSSVTIPNVYYSGAGQYTYVAYGEDSIGNISQENIVVNAGVPAISVLSVDYISDVLARATSQITQDIDEGVVKFQKYRNGERVTLSGVNGGITKTMFPVTVNQTFATGGLFDLAKKVTLYNDNSEVIGYVSNDSNIQILPGEKDNFDINVTFKSGVPVIEIFDKILSKTIFILQVKPKTLAGATPIDILNGNVSLLPLGPEQGTFAGGSCLKRPGGSCEMYISSKGNIYVPTPYNNSLQGTYEFVNGTIQYVVKDIDGTNLLRIKFTPDLLFKNE